jgi:hypothetical protein
MECKVKFQDPETGTCQDPETGICLPLQDPETGILTGKIPRPRNRDTSISTAIIEQLLSLVVPDADRPPTRPETGDRTNGKTRATPVF